MCKTIEEKWAIFKKDVLGKDDRKTVVNLQYFVPIEKLSNGRVVKRLEAKSMAANLVFILDFISKRLTGRLLKIPVKFEPQSLHWSHEQITVHSGILKYNGVKSYHPYISDDRKHDQHFVKIAMKEML